MGVEKTYNWDQEEGHSLLANALAPVAGRRRSGIQNVPSFGFTLHTCGAGYPPKLKLLLTGGRSDVPEWDSRMSKLRAWFAP